MAKKFQFRLDVVGEIRKRVRDEIARSVGAKVRETLAARRVVEQLSASLASTAQEARSQRLERRLSVSELRSQQYYGKWLHDKAAATSVELGRLEEKLAKEREKLAAATARVKAIEKLRERRWQEYQGSVKREEQAVMDEIAGRIGSGREMPNEVETA